MHSTGFFRGRALPRFPPISTGFPPVWADLKGLTGVADVRAGETGGSFSYSYPEEAGERVGVGVGVGVRGGGGGGRGARLSFVGFQEERRIVAIAVQSWWGEALISPV